MLVFSLLSLLQSVKALPQRMVLPTVSWGWVFPSQFTSSRNFFTDVYRALGVCVRARACTETALYIAVTVVELTVNQACLVPLVISFLASGWSRLTISSKQPVWLVGLDVWDRSSRALFKCFKQLNMKPQPSHCCPPPASAPHLEDGPTQSSVGRPLSPPCHNHEAQLMAGSSSSSFPTAP